MLKYQLFPRSIGVETKIQEVIDCFQKKYEEIDSSNHNHKSNEVLKIISHDLKKLKFKVEESKASSDKIKVPVLFGHNNKTDKSFNADALSDDKKIVIEVEAGRAFVNNQFLKDVFQACMMYDVEYLVIAVRNIYGKKKHKDFDEIFNFFETLYINGRLKLPLKGIVLIGY